MDLDYNTSLLLITRLKTLENKFSQVIDTNRQILCRLMERQESLIRSEKERLEKLDKKMEYFIDLYLYNKPQFRAFECKLYMNYFFEICYYEINCLNTLEIHLRVRLSNLLRLCGLLLHCGWIRQMHGV